MPLRSCALASIGLLVLIVGCEQGGPAGSGGSGGGGGQGGGVTTTPSATAGSSAGGGGSGGGTGGTGNTGTGAQGGGGAAPNVCGDGVALDEEECDGADLKGADCTLFGYSNKPGVTCSGECTFDATGCMPSCDGALLEPGEECDGQDLGNHDCTELGFTGKVGAKCNATCTGIVTGNCKATCDGAGVEPGEACDGANLAGKTCKDYGFDAAGGLGCAACEFDASGCAGSCDGAHLEPDEECDGASLGGKTCADFGYVSAAGLDCSPACMLDTSGCTASCGNGVKEPGEECDGAAGAGQTCVGCALKYTAVINEIWYDPPGADGSSGACFIEILGAPGLDLTGYALKFVDGTGGAEYVAQLKLDGKAIGAGGYFVAVQTAEQQAALPAGANGVVSTKTDMQNGPDNLVLTKDGTAVDAIGYGTFMANFVGEGSPAADPADSPQTLCRLPNGKDTGNNSLDFTACSPTPGAVNAP